MELRVLSFMLTVREKENNAFFTTKPHGTGMGLRVRKARQRNDAASTNKVLGKQQRFAAKLDEIADPPDDHHGGIRERWYRP